MKFLKYTQAYSFTTSLFLGLSLNAQTPTTTKNSVMEQMPRDAMTTLVGTDYTNVQSKINYVDGIGRPTQSILYRGSADGDKDILASTFQYDILGRQAKVIIPVASSTGDGAINNNAETLAKSFYQDQNPFTEVNEYDNSPLNRVLKNYGVGEAWRTAQKPTQANFKVTSDYQVRGYVIRPSGAVDNNYNVGAIFQNVTIDERGNDMSEYIDKSGKTVLKALNSDNGYLYTAYIYDDMNRLRFIVPPKSYDLQDSFIEDSDYFREGIFAYKYDQRGRVKAKHIAGAGWTFIVYDKRDLPVMTQDSKDRENNRYQFTKYDAWARPILTGFVNSMGTDTTARNNLQNLFEEFDGILIPFEERSETGDVLLHYTNDKSFPITVKPIEANVLTANYYDNYDNWTNISINFKTDSAFHSPYPSANGLTAGMQYRNLGNLDWLYLSNFYDDKGRIIQQSMTNHLGETDRMDTEYRFNGEIKTQRAIYRRPSQAAVTIKNRFRYDHQSRKIAMFYILNGDSLKMAGYQYDPIGRLLKKSLMPLNEVFSKQSGLWTQASTWKLGDIPMINDHVTINNGHIISIPSNSIAKAGQLNDFGALTMSNTSTLNMGRPRNKPLQTLDYSYHIKSGGLRGINLDVNGNPSLAGGDLFSLKLGYEEDGTYYDKNIRSQTWISAVDGLTRSYTYSYDNSNKILGAVYTGGRPNENYSLENMSYDKNGNILSLWRKGMSQTNTFDYTDKLTYSYGTYSNKLDAVTDAVNGNLNTGDFRDVAGTNDYTYWNDGSLKSDLNKGIDSIKYNHLKLPNRIKFSNGNWIQYWYDALGKKLRKSTSENIITDYLGGLIYENNNLYQIINDEGRFTNGLYEYGITDHLGNLRVSFKDSLGIAKITQAQDYEPWGGENWTSRYVNTGLVNRHKFNSKEQIPELGFYEYGFRWYNPNNARFITIDPLAEKYPYKSTYDYAENEPIGGIDLDGLERVAISGAVPPSQFGDGNSYNATHVKYFYAQTLNLQKYGFVPFQVYNGQQLLGALEKTTKEHGSVSFLALFGHAGYTDNNGGLYLSHNEGFYSQPLEVRQGGNKSASISDLTKMIEEKDVKFAKDAVCFIDGCNSIGGGTPDFRSDPSHRLLGEELVMKTGVTVIGGTGHVEMANPKLADGRFTITDGGNFYKLTRTTEETPNPNKSWWEFWKPDTIQKTTINAQNLGSTININNYVK